MAVLEERRNWITAGQLDHHCTDLWFLMSLYQKDARTCVVYILAVCLFFHFDCYLRRMLG